VILHDITKDDVPVIEAIKGKKVEISCRDDRIGEIREESRAAGTQLRLEPVRISLK
jgi:hypothetical protein